ncbi:metal-dependent hydrolase family protein [Streptomyces sparsogenes]|uniref:Amidohydrolase n=1 Tax=Streptomyces sparsogenes DSM 40356 TaxID=1331668 RepID=A0A1R1SCG3_9ACTN|nr:amidohydrolase family protein [Streptomyces sparsogenes]OMI35912.1 Amidohydrolase [Streptomyces sparsogenes DSM 40356]
MTPTTPLKITGARLIDGTGAEPVSDAVVLTDEQGDIAYAGPAADAPDTGLAYTVVDAAGRTVLPGFIDCHVHFGFENPRELGTRISADPTVETFRTAERLRRTLYAGVTTARDLGGLPSGYRKAVAEGLIEGPRVHTAVRIIGHTGGHADFTTPSGIDLSGGVGEIADTTDEVRKAVRRLLRDGADVIKLCATGGMGSPHDQPEDEGLTEEEIRAVVDEARRHGGRPVAAHAQGTAGILNAIRGGVTSIEHGYGLDSRARELARERGTFVVPTLSTVFDGIDKATMAPYHYEKKVRWSGITKENISAAIADGLRIAMGTDSGVCPHGRNLRELAHLVSLGMSPMDAIGAGTRVAAQLLGLDDRVGTLRAGKAADIVICDGDPLADISLLGDPAQVRCVIQQGVVRKNSLAL